VTIDGTPVATRPVLSSGRAPSWTMNFWNPPAQGFDVTLEVKGTAALRVIARASTPGLPPIPGTAYRERPPDTMPISANPASIEQDSSTVVSRSFRFGVP
jgi:hypothetical protein